MESFQFISLRLFFHKIIRDMVSKMDNPLTLAKEMI